MLCLPLLRKTRPRFAYLAHFRHVLEHHVPLYVSASTVPYGTEFDAVGIRIFVRLIEPIQKTHPPSDPAQRALRRFL